MKKLWRLFPIVIILLIILYFEIKYKNQRNKFYKSSIDSVILKKENNWTGGRSVDYITTKGIIITALKNNSLQVNDSISKKANTNSYNVYIKNRKGKYQFYKKLRND